MPFLCPMPGRSRSCGKLQPIAKPVISGRERRKQSSAKVRPTPESCLWVNSREIKRTARVILLSGRQGKLMNKALAEAGIERTDVYVTNVVKHFSWAASGRGKRRIHKKPRYSEIRACRPWLDAELQVVKPEILVCLGATAAQSLLGREFSVNRQRGQLVDSSLAPYVTATVHPSSILRAPDDQSRRLQMRAFINDLKKVRHLAEKRRAA